ncbi:hypothetical protein C6B38_09275, partial [Spiroplasma sp. ChiS]
LTFNNNFLAIPFLCKSVIILYHSSVLIFVIFSKLKPYSDNQLLTYSWYFFVNLGAFCTNFGLIFCKFFSIFNRLLIFPKLEILKPLEKSFRANFPIVYNKV